MSVIDNSSLKQPTIVVIGGGATGVGIARDAALRGLKVVVVERGAIGSGTTGHFHGILHSGARYAVNDAQVAGECYEENQTLRELLPSAIINTGGLFVALTPSEAAHADVVMAACKAAGIKTKEITAAQALSREPSLNPALLRAFTVPDGYINGVELLNINKRIAKEARTPAWFMTNHEVVSFHTGHRGITHVVIKDIFSGAEEVITCDIVVNAAGVWASKVAQLVSLHFEMVYDKGTMIQFEHQLTSAIINRCRPESDGDLLVSNGINSVMGTTSQIISDLDDNQPTQQDADLLMREGIKLVPALQSARAVAVYSGVRPLFNSGELAQTGARGISRSYKIIDHAPDGLDNFISVVGGKVTLYRRMAAAAVDAVCEKLESKSG